jgi:hypothetical protein
MRTAVRYKNKPLMPMKGTRVRKFIELKLGKIKYDRKLKLHYLELKYSPSDTKTQVIVLGIDPGSSFDGFSVVSADTHHCNYELIQRAKKGKYSIKKFLERRATNRRLRRSRLWHRPIRFSNRTSKKLAPTIRANVDMRKWLINKLAEYFPISKIVVEDVKFNHFKSNKGSSFSAAEQGKTELYKFISHKWQLELVNGFNTKNLRIVVFGHDIKSSNKADRRFEAHCIDSFVIAFTAIQSKYSLNVNSHVLFIKKIVRIRRQLTQLRPRRYTKAGINHNQYYRLSKGGIKRYYQNISKNRNVCRVKPEGVHSNHPKQWIYLNNGFAEKSKSKLRLFGGTVLTDYFINNEFINRKFL